MFYIPIVREGAWLKKHQFNHVTTTGVVKLRSKTRSKYHVFQSANTHVPAGRQTYKLSAELVGAVLKTPILHTRASRINRRAMSIMCVSPLKLLPIVYVSPPNANVERIYN